jgi:hypothetical protein
MSTLARVGVAHRANPFPDRTALCVNLLDWMFMIKPG